MNDSIVEIPLEKHQKNVLVSYANGKTTEHGNDNDLLNINQITRLEFKNLVFEAYTDHFPVIIPNPEEQQKSAHEDQ
jgi:hypothetical protein